MSDGSESRKDGEPDEKAQRRAAGAARQHAIAIWVHGTSNKFEENLNFRAPVSLNGCLS